MRSHDPAPGGRPARTPTDVLQFELVQEKAANLGRLGRRLEQALEALRALPVPADPSSSPAAHAEREAKLVDAGEALFLYVVQREVCGLRDTATVLELMQVPHEVRLRMAPRSVQRRK